jgi:hypothetical protein
VKDKAQVAQYVPKRIGSDLNDYSTVFQDNANHPDSDEDSEWPRRLLIVPTMTFHKWQLDDIYGGVSKPTYSIISCT